MADLDNLIDSKISLISHQDVRYDGTLFSINTSESSIVLKDVKCLGTEGRVTDESKKIPSNPTVIPFVTFPGQEIKDLYVHENPEPAPTQQAASRKTESSRPNNRQQNPPKSQNSYDQHDNRNNNRNNNNGRQQPHQQTHNNNQGQGNRPQQSQAPQQQKKEQQAPRQQHHEPRTSNAGTGAHLLHLREKRGDAAGAVDKQDTATVFDFEAGLNIFKKDEVLAKVATDDVVAAVKETKYKKDDFFDMLSTDRSAREEGQSQQARMTASQERSLNQDTFGAIALQGGGGGYRRHYGRGNGGRGGGRGSGGGRGRGRGRQSSN